MAEKTFYFEIDGKVYVAAMSFVGAVRAESEQSRRIVENTHQWKNTRLGGGREWLDLANKLVRKFGREGRKVFKYRIDNHKVELPVKYGGKRIKGRIRDDIPVPLPSGIERLVSPPVPKPRKTGPTQKDLEEERKKINALSGLLGRQGIKGKEREAVVKARVNQGVFRDGLLEVYGPQCCITGISNEKLLIASHIKPWSESEEHERLIPQNGLLLNALYDKAFDRGLITFDDNYKLKVSQGLASSQDGRLYEMLLKDEGKPIKGFQPDKKYLRWHRRKHGFEK